METANVEKVFIIGEMVLEIEEGRGHTLKDFVEDCGGEHRVKQLSFECLSKI